MKIIIIVLKLLFIGALFIVSNQNLHLIDSADRNQFFETYSGWIATLVDQGTQLTGYVVKFEWLPSKDGGFSSGPVENIH